MKDTELSLFVDMPSGVSGDMLLAALIGVCGKGILPEFSQALSRLLGKNFEVALTQKEECGLVCNQIQFPFKQNSSWIGTIDPHKHGRHLSEIEKLLDHCGFDSYVVENSKKVFKMLGEAESHVHGVNIEKIHFHEVGALDSICDVVGFFWLLHYLKIRNVYCSFFTVGRGTVSCEHGEMPVPVPAVVKLLENHSALVIRTLENTGELTTPTGCAILLSCGIFENVPELYRYKNSAFGLGQRVIPGKFNAVRISLIEPLSKVTQEQKVVHIITNIDDSTPQVLSNLCEELFCIGALDVWQETILMKKFRMGTQVNVLCNLTDKEQMMNMILSNSSSLGCRYQIVDRRILPRKKVSFLYEGSEIFLKVYQDLNGTEKIRIENDSVVEFCTKKNYSYVDSLKILRNMAEDLLSKDKFG